ncbi:cell wall-binding repeat-containing protein [Clostridium aciditolerans]|uniref:Cell wall-binding repeat-containing protein n=1 Tax=Clostridium aciditolerans TaxID=339861 RepID=A0A934HYP6_9CLOT|nr:cell wall-binding repeat-containing protein [Clostridium aciditolerans]MBI6873669.1 cell wall-binding repeat-containing protein [Clostridium aciditolerans]
MNMKKIACLLSISLCLSIGVTTRTKAAVNPERIGGANRYDTSIAVSKNGWNATSDYVVIASGEDFGDALSAAPLAKKYNAPILLVSKDNLDNQSDSASNLTNELSRLKAKKAFIIGGTGSVSSKVEDAIKNKGIEIERISGNDRYDTSVEIAKKVGANNGVIIAKGDDFIDALSAAPIAASKEMPIILVPKDKVNDTLQNYLKNNNISKTYVIGDKDIINDDVVKQFPNTERITGNNEYERNINTINKFSKDLKYDTVYFASRKGFADSLSGSALAALTASPIILVDENSEAKVKEYIDSKIKDIGQVNVLGGEGVVNTSLLEKILPMNKNQGVNSGLLKATLNQNNINSMESDSTIGVNASVKDLPKEEQSQADKIIPIINNSKMNFNIKMNGNSNKTLSNVQEDISIQVAGMNIQTTAWVSLDMTGSQPKMKEIVKIPEVAAQYLPPQFAGKQYMVMDPIAVDSKVMPGANNITGLMDFSKNFQPQFQSFMEKYLENWNPGFKFIDYKGLMRVNNKDGIKYAQTYQLKLNDMTFKSLLNYTATDAVQNKEFISFMKQFMLSCVDLSGAPNKEQQKQDIEKVFANMASNPQESMKQIKTFMDAIKDLKVIGDKGIDITYNICDGYIIGETGVVDLQLDIHKFVEVMNKLSNTQGATTEDVKGILGLGFNYNTQNYNINKDVKITIPQLTKENSFDYMELINLGNNK